MGSLGHESGAVAALVTEQIKMKGYQSCAIGDGVKGRTDRKQNCGNMKNSRMRHDRIEKGKALGSMDSGRVGRIKY